MSYYGCANHLLSQNPLAYLPSKNGCKSIQSPHFGNHPALSTSRLTHAFLLGLNLTQPPSANNRTLEILITRMTHPQLRIDDRAFLNLVILPEAPIQVRLCPLVPLRHMLSISTELITN